MWDSGLSLLPELAHNRHTGIKWSQTSLILFGQICGFDHYQFSHFSKPEEINMAKRN